MTYERMKSAPLLPKLVEMVFYLVISTSFAIGVVWWNEGPPMIVVERELVTPQVRQGDQLSIANMVIATKTCPVEVHRSIVDSHGVRHELEAEVVWPDEEVGEFRYVSTVTVPDFVHEGKAVYRVRAEWHCNPLQEFFTRTITFSDVDFEVLAP